MLVDAVLAALGINRGIDAILATDRAFDGINALERIDPTDKRAISTLVS
jgi:predicted nucleic acid-binding protein